MLREEEGVPVLIGVPVRAASVGEKDAHNEAEPMAADGEAAFVPVDLPLPDTAAAVPEGAAAVLLLATTVALRPPLLVPNPTAPDAEADPVMVGEFEGSKGDAVKRAVMEEFCVTVG